MNGYALGPDIAVGAVCAVIGTLTPGEPLDRWGRPLVPGLTESRDEASLVGTSDSASAPMSPTSEPSHSGGEVWRVETGALLPAGTRLVLPPEDTTIVGSKEIRVDRLPAAGHGLHAIGSLASAPAFPRGTFLDARVRAVLGASGVSMISLRPSFSVGFATVGDELLDPGAVTSAAGWPDLLGLALEETIRGLGLLSVPLGITGDSPPAIESVLFGASGRVDVMILVGGLGDGIADRVVETLGRMEAEVAVSGRFFGPGAQLVLARVQGFDVLAVGGRPLSAALLLDAIVRPALLSRLGAPPPTWDWSRIAWPLDLEASPGPEGPVERWQAFPATLTPSPGSAPRIRAWDAPTPFLPILPEQRGWALVPPSEVGADCSAGRKWGTAHYVPLGPHLWRPA
jgi:hypothetical protein